ncbi:MAG: hypothetical protein OHK93_000221 [Ramalina farinacea]|uniref:Ribosome assembly protein 3 n=1 Tax=Ramalina farinacea TaxID=258253 RepID=A0AA43TUV8_9LECA|nr:hypothetical protein [Ramalina farinacea]
MEGSSASRRKHTEPSNTESAQITAPKDGSQAKHDLSSDFEQFYLQKATAEFADDIEKLRKATDFKESSVPVLIAALKQGAGNFTVDQKRKVMTPQG